MGKYIIILGILALIAGCSSSSTGSGSPAPPARSEPGDVTKADASCPFEGTYDLIEKVDTTAVNSCGATDATTPITVTVTATGVIVVQGVTGGCAGSVNGCKLTAACQGQLTAGGNANWQVSWTFDAKGFTGTTAYGLAPDDKPKCYATMLATGVRK